MEHIILEDNLHWLNQNIYDDFYYRNIHIKWALQKMSVIKKCYVVHDQDVCLNQRCADDDGRRLMVLVEHNLQLVYIVVLVRHFHFV